ncbi:MAG: hypothetical protein FWD76_03070 [Firmicutes bacterium]|nr:hypothetical protein [Bacillota bacterium]
MGILVTKRATFTDNELIIHQKLGEDIVVNLYQITNVIYDKLTFKNCVWAGLTGYFRGTPGYLDIRYERNGKRNRQFLMRLKYGDALKLPYCFIDLIRQYGGDI